MFDLPRPKRCSSKSIFSLNRRPTLLLVLSLFVYVIHRVHTLATDPELMKMSDSLSVPASVRHWDVRLFGTHQQILGEGPFYDHARNRFYQVDIKGKKVIRLNLSSDVSLPVQFQHQTRNFSEVVSFVIPLQEPNGDLMVVGARNQILIYDFENDRIVRQLDFSNILKENERFNDAKCDRKGRLFVGTMLEDPTNNTVIPLSGDLYRLDGEQLTAVAHQFTVSNGMAWSSDDSTFYFNDSDDQKIWRFDYDITSGQVSNQRLLIDVKQNRLGIRSNEYPDGMCIDANDNLWIALWGGARVVKIDVQKEKVVDSVYTGSTRTSSACFGELQGQKVLFITSAHYSGDAQQERSGRSFVLLGRSDLNAITPNQYFDGRHLIVA